MKRLAVLPVFFWIASVALAAEHPAAVWDDAPLVKYFGSQFTLYLAARSPRELPGPLLQAWIKKVEESMATGSKPEDLLARAVHEKVIARPFDVFASGLAVGAVMSANEQHMLLAVPRTPAADKVVAWLKTALKSGPLTGRPTKIEGQDAVEVLINGQVQLVAAVDGTVVILADRVEEIVDALKCARSPLHALSLQRSYARLRTRVKADAAAFAVLTPGRDLVEFIRRDAAKLPGAQFMDTFVTMLDAYMIQLSGDAKAQQADFYFGLDPKSEGYARLHLAERVKFYAAHTLKLAATVPADVGLFATGLQPTYDTRELPTTVGFMGQEGAASNQQQWDILKGQLQVFTGLSFDGDIVPWLGSESCFVMRVVPGDHLEGAVLLETKDAKAAQGALDKAVRHMSISQNKTFTEKMLGPIHVRLAEPVPDSPVTPALAVLPEAFVLASGPATIEAIVQFPLKASGSDTHVRLLKAIGDTRIVMLAWAQADLVTRLAKNIEEMAARQANREPRRDVAAVLDGVDAVGLGLSMSDSDTIHGVVHTTTK